MAKKRKAKRPSARKRTVRRPARTLSLAERFALAAQARAIAEISLRVQKAIKRRRAKKLARKPPVRKLVSPRLSLAERFALAAQTRHYAQETLAAKRALAEGLKKKEADLREIRIIARNSAMGGDIAGIYAELTMYRDQHTHLLDQDAMRLADKYGVTRRDIYSIFYSP